MNDTYYDKMSDDEKTDLATSYFSIGHDGEDGEESDKHYCWMWNGNDVIYKKGGTHPINFGCDVADKTFKGWYDTTKDIISVSFPSYELRKLGNRTPTEDDIPQYLYTKLLSKFGKKNLGKRNPVFVVFENKHNIIKEIKSPYIIVGMIDFNLNVISSDNIESHSRLLNKYPQWHNRQCYNWRFNANNNTLYWYNDPTDDMISVVKDEIKKKYPYYHVLKQSRISSNDIINYQKQQRSAHGMNEMKKSQLKTLIKEIIKQITKEDKNFAQPIKFWWMDNHNEFHQVKFEEHRYWAEQYLEKHGHHVTDYSDVYKMIYKLGFIRVGKTRYGNDVILSYQYSENRPPNLKQKSKLKELAIIEHCNYLVDDLTKKEEKLDIPQDNIGGVTENMTYDDLLKLTDKTPRSPEDDTSRIDRAKTVRARSIPVSMEENVEQWNFRYKSNPSRSNPEKSLEGNIIFLKGEVNKSDDAMKLECKVDCSCRDYKYRFAHNNFKQGAGDIGPDSLNQCINRSPQLAYDIGEGLCKHLVALRGYLQTKIAATQKNNLFEAINEVSKQGPFNITYYD